MLCFRVSILPLILSCTILHTAHNLQYSDLERMGKACPGQHQCSTTNIQSPVKDCYCDSACATYQDCCVGFQSQPGEQAVPPESISCLNYRHNFPFGIYAVSACRKDWNGPVEIKQNCEGNFIDPTAPAPVISTTRGITYKNRYCAVCNNADTGSLRDFLSNLTCTGVGAKEEVNTKPFASYQESYKRRGSRMDSEENSNNTECELRFSVPTDMMKYIHFCRVNMISECARDWPLPEDKKLCKEYMAVVHDKDHRRSYKNPHCAVCNNKAESELRCSLAVDFPSDTFNMFDLTRLLRPYDICPSKHIYDPFHHVCHSVRCALPGYVVRNKKCVPDY